MGVASVFLACPGDPRLSPKARKKAVDVRDNARIKSGDGHDAAKMYSISSERALLSAPMICAFVYPSAVFQARKVRGRAGALIC